MFDKRCCAPLFALLIFFCFDSTIRAADPKDPNGLNSQLLQAAANGDSDQVKLLLAQGADVDVSDGNFVAPIYIAAGRGHLSTVQALIEAGADVQNGALGSGAFSGNPDVVRALLAAGARPDYAFGGPILINVIGDNKPANLEVVRALIEAGADVNARDGQGYTPLSMAFVRDRSDMIQLLLQSGARPEALKESMLTSAAKRGDLQEVASIIAAGTSVDARNTIGATPLSEAVCSGQLAMVHYLLRAGANVNLPTGDGYLPLMLASIRQNPMIFHALLNSGADVNAKSNKPTALMGAVEQGRKEFVQPLIAAGADLNVRDEYGYSALVYAIKPLGYNSYLNSQTQTEIVKMLLEAGADVYPAALKYAVEVRSSEIIRILRQAGAKPWTESLEDLKYSISRNEETKIDLLLSAGIELNKAESGDPPLLDAIRYGSGPIVIKFLDAGADPNAVSNGASPLEVAVSAGKTEAVRALIQAGARLEANGSALLQTAAESGLTDIVRILQQAGASSKGLNETMLRGFVQDDLRNNHPDQAAEHLAQFRKRYPKKDVSSELIAISQCYLRAKNYERAQILLKEIPSRFPKSENVPAAYVSLAEVYEAFGDEENMVASYRNAISSRSGKNPEEVSSVAQRLAMYYMKKKDWAEALKWWQAWSPTSWCGNELSAMQGAQAYYAAFCKIHLGQTEEGLRLMESEMGGFEFEPNLQIPLFLVDYYREQNQLSDFEKRLGGCPVSTSPSIGGSRGFACEYIRIIHMTEQKDLEGLWF